MHVNKSLNKESWSSYECICSVSLFRIYNVLNDSNAPPPSFFPLLLPLLSSSSWVRWRWMGRLSRCVSRSTVKCSPRLWRLPWTAWTPWTPCLCPDASGCGATATWEQSTRAVLGRRKEKEGGRCSCCHPPRHAHLPPPSEPSRAAQVGRSVWMSLYASFCPYTRGTLWCLHMRIKDCEPVGRIHVGEESGKQHLLRPHYHC